MGESVLLSVQLFEGLPLDVLAQVDSALKRRVVEAGQWLFQRGEVADRVSILMHGRVEVVVHERRRLLGPGAVLGELGFLNSEPRSASVRAVRDSEFLELSFDDFATILGENARVAFALARMLARRLERSRDESGPVAKPSVFAFVSCHELGKQIADEIVSCLKTLEDTAVVEKPDASDDDFAGILSRAEQASSRVVLRADTDADSDWRHFCTRQADRVVLVVDAGASPPARVDEFSGCQLVLASDRQGAHASRWLELVRPRSHHLVSNDSLDSIPRTARRLLGRSLGIVLSGGGARALAHIGVLREIADAGLHIDRIGGTSMGAFIAGLVGLGRTVDEIQRVCMRELVSGRPFADYTVPRTALIKGRRAETMLRNVFGDALIEDLGLRMFCASADLVSGELVIHRTGPLGLAIGASMSLPGLAPPRSIDGRLLVDGGVLDNLPVGPMVAEDEGPVIAVDVIRREAPINSADRRPSLLDTLARSTMLGSLQRAKQSAGQADLVISPDVRRIGLLDFKSIDAAIEGGRLAAQKALSEWDPDGVGPANSTHVTQAPPTLDNTEFRSLT